MCIRCQALLVNFDCCGLWVRDAEPLKAALSLTPEFLRAPREHAGLQGALAPVRIPFREPTWCGSRMSALPVPR